jgi:hypothetical protein
MRSVGQDAQRRDHEEVAVNDDFGRGLNRHDRQFGEPMGIAGAAGGLIGALIITPLVLIGRLLMRWTTLAVRRIRR